jgi:Tn3 transposase DDE domain
MSKEILSTVNRYTHYVDELQHWQQPITAVDPQNPRSFAGVIGIGCMIGLRKMMRISHPINEAEVSDLR